jgi:hypothetical protein
MTKHVGVSTLLPDSKNIKWKDKTLFISAAEIILRLTNCKHTEQNKKLSFRGFLCYITTKIQTWYMRLCGARWL